MPPPVPAVGLGGAAAGKSPYGAPIMEATENPPTTVKSYNFCTLHKISQSSNLMQVKPSALLNVLNKADRGINQAITHFEQGSPLETAAIDILEGLLAKTNRVSFPQDPVINFSCSGIAEIRLSSKTSGAC